MLKKKTDVLIIGGGLTGASLLLALQGLGYSVLLVESQPFNTNPATHFDVRSLALSPASKRILALLGVWHYLKEDATPIKTIHVSHQGQFGLSQLHGQAGEPLGHVIEMQSVNKALHQLIPKEQLLAPATLRALDLEQCSATVSTFSGEYLINAQLIVAADGANSTVRQLCQIGPQIKDYNQQGIVANVGLAQSHHYQAYERFTRSGPLALLPMKEKKMSLVWANETSRAQELMCLNDASFLQELQLAFGYRLGKFIQLGKRFSYPLQQVLTKKQIHGPVVFVGNAAQTLHPVAGQGFNLGLRDTATLAQCIVQYGLNPAMLSEYLKLRAHDHQTIIKGTDGLIQLFSSALPGMGLARGVGLIALDLISPLKNLLQYYASGFGGHIPDLACQIALKNKDCP